MSRPSLLATLLAIASFFLLGAHAAEIPTIRHAVEMTRIHAFGVTPDNKVAAISPDGKKAAIVIWRGDIERNTNVFSLLIYDMSKLREQRPDPVLSWDFPGDPEEQFTSPIAHIRFLQDNRTVSFLGRKDGAQAQVYTVDVYTRELRQLTDHPSAVRSYVMGDHGKVLAYSAVAPSSEGLATNPLIEDGVFLWDRSVFSRFSKYSLTSPLIRWGEGHPPIRKYFASRGGEFVEFFDSRRNVIPLDHPKAEQTESAVSRFTSTWTKQPRQERRLRLLRRPR